MKKTAIVLFVLWCISSYPLNYAMMKRGTGFYNNDPNHEWRVLKDSPQQGPSRAGRFIYFAISPVTALPSSLLAFIDGTIPPNHKGNRAMSSSPLTTEEKDLPDLNTAAGVEAELKRVEAIYEATRKAMLVRWQVRRKHLRALLVVMKDQDD